MRPGMRTSVCVHLHPSQLTKSPKAWKVIVWFLLFFFLTAQKFFYSDPNFDGSKTVQNFPTAQNFPTIQKLLQKWAAAHFVGPKKKGKFLPEKIRGKKWAVQNFSTPSSGKKKNNIWFPIRTWSRLSQVTPYLTCICLFSILVCYLLWKISLLNSVY